MTGWGPIPDPWIDPRAWQSDPVARGAAEDAAWATDVLGQEHASRRAQEFRSQQGAQRQAEFYQQLQSEAMWRIDHERRAALAAGLVPVTGSTAPVSSYSAPARPMTPAPLPNTVPLPNRRLRESRIWKAWWITTLVAFIPCLLIWGAASGHMNHPDPSTGGASGGDFLVGLGIAAVVGLVAALVASSRES
jgi:hypothetical protein